MGKVSCSQGGKAQGRNNSMLFNGFDRDFFPKDTKLVDYYFLSCP